MEANKKRRNVISLFLTLIIISLLILSGPVFAVHVGVSTDKATYTSSDDTVTFTVTIDLEAGEKIPFHNLTLDINGTTGNESEICVFSVGGTKLTTCSNIEITATISTGYEYGYGYGYGYGYSSTTNTWSNTTFNWGYGYGYGYGEGETNAGTDMTYTVAWNFSAADAGDGTYTSFIDAIAQNETGNYYIYRSSIATFTIDTTETTTTTTTTTLRSSSGGGVTFTSTNNYGAKQSRAWAVIAAGTLVTMPVNTPNIPITNMKVTVNNEATNVKITVAELTGTPSDMTLLSGNVNKYMEIYTSGLTGGDIGSVEIEFRVEKSWFTSVGIGEGDIALYRFTNGAWTQLATEVVSSDSEYVYFKSTSPGLSYFTIAEKGAAPSGLYTAFEIIDFIKEFYAGTSSYTAFEIIDIIKAFYGG